MRKAGTNSACSVGCMSQPGLSRSSASLRAQHPVSEQMTHSNRGGGSPTRLSLKYCLIPFSLSLPLSLSSYARSQRTRVGPCQTGEGGTLNASPQPELSSPTPPRPPARSIVIWYRPLGKQPRFPHHPSCRAWLSRGAGPTRSS